MTNKYSRRQFLRLGAAAVATTLLPACKKDEDTINPSMEKARDVDYIETYDEAVARYITTYLDSNYPEYCKLGHRPDDADPGECIGGWLSAEDMEEVEF